MQYQVAATAMLGSFTMMMIGGGTASGGLLGMATAGVAWPLLEYCNHKVLHTDQSARHAYHHKHSRVYPQIQVNLGPMVAAMHMSMVFMLWWMFSWMVAMGYSWTIALLYACYEGAHESGHLADTIDSPLTWAVRNSHAWHWRHHQRPKLNYGVSTPCYDLMFGTADWEMGKRYLEGWRGWLLPIPWVVFALTPPDPNAPYDKMTQAEQEKRSAEARWRRTADERGRFSE
jgi:hypothetical protein